MVAVSMLSRYPEVLKDLFQMDEKDKLEDFKIKQNGRYDLKVYMMGEPITFSIDDIIPFGRVSKTHFRPLQAQLNQQTWSLWPLIVEKVWAKAKGNYELSHIGFIENGISFLTGAPTMRVKLYAYRSRYRKLWNKLFENHRLGYMQATTTSGIDNTQVNEYGLA